MTREEIRVIVEAIIVELGRHFEKNAKNISAAQEGFSVCPEKICEGLLLEEDVNAFYKEGFRALFITKKCIATPLALDRASDLKMMIRHEEVS